MRCSTTGQTLKIGNREFVLLSKRDFERMAAQITGQQRWFEAARHWGDLLAENRLREKGLQPWSRYANPQDVLWEDRLTGGVVYILDFFDELIRAGYTGRDNALLEARRAGVDYLRDVLLPNWTGYDTWGRNFWDWPCPTRVENVTTFAARGAAHHPPLIFAQYSWGWVRNHPDTFPFLGARAEMACNPFPAPPGISME